MKNVVLVINNPLQGNACGFITEYEKLGGKVDGVLCKKPKKNSFYYLKSILRIPYRFIILFQPTNIKKNIIQIIKEISRKQFLNEVFDKWNNIGENSWDLLTESFNIEEYAFNNGIPYDYSLNFSSEIVKKHTKKGPTMFLMYSGGIISNDLLSIDNAEFLNAHMGEMPIFKGMNVIEWAILENKNPKVAVMIMNSKIDGGDVIYHKDIKISTEKTISELRKIGYIYCYKAMAEGVFNYLTDKNVRKKQKLGGKFYYRMHKSLRERVENKLNSTTKLNT
tara:strand:- start:113 stop:949 length:837 start_codon:yes stop_codon:yes gene_type:complete